MLEQKLVVKYEKSPVWYIGALVIALLLLFFSFYIGRHLAVIEGKRALQQVNLLQNELNEYRAAYQKANQDLVMQVQHAKVDHLSNKQLIQTIKELENTQNQLQSELKFYRNIMAPELAQEGLTIEKFDTSAAITKGRSKFKLVLTQAGKQNQFLKGDVELNIKGTHVETGLPVVYPFNQLGDFQSKDFQFKFRYFQEIKGEISLPKDFMPQQVTILAKTRGLKKNQVAEKQIDWQVNET